MKSIGLLTFALVLAMGSPALATGTVRIQQNDNSVQTYTGVALRIIGKTLAITSADRVSTVVISGGNCEPIGDLTRCTGGVVSLNQDGKMHVIPFDHATFYFNLTDQDETLPMSTIKIRPHSVMFAANTVKGTYITGNGRLDKEPSR